MKIAIVADHAGFYLKEKIREFLIREKHEFRDFGTFSSQAVDYPDFGHPMAFAVSSGECDLGISICGTGNGMNMVANKHQGIRSALCWNEETGRLARLHNDANVCAIPARFVSDAEGLLIAKVFLETSFEGGRHVRRIEKIPLKLY